MYHFKLIAEFYRTHGLSRIAITTSDNEKLMAANTDLFSNFATSVGLAAETGPPFCFVPFSPTFGRQTWIPVPFATSFTSRCLATVPYSHEDATTLQVLASLLTHHYLHREIREKNGAYGGGATYSTIDGLFSFYSYRDPNPEKSISTFRQASEWATGASFTAQVW